MGCGGNCGDEIPFEKPKLTESRELRASIAAWLFLSVSAAAAAFGAPAGVALASYVLAILTGSFYFAREALEKLWNERSIGIELLMTLAIASAAALGHFREGALVAGLYSITEALEGFTIRRTRFAIRSLMDRVPPTARKLVGADEVAIDAEAIAVGDRLVVRPGEAVPTDGVIREGASALDESAVTGESLPVERRMGDAVFAGSLNGQGALVVEATRAFRDNTVHKIIELVEHAQQQKGRSQLLVERFGRIYSPAVLLVAVLLAVVPVLMGAEPIAWVTRAASFLVAAAPCALAIATPVTLVAAIGSAAKRGVLIKGGHVLEALGKTSAVAIDKTGTLTQGKPRVVGIYPTGQAGDDVLRLAASVERLSEHPLGEAIVGAARAKGLALLTAEAVEALTAAGVQATIGLKHVRILKPSAAFDEGVCFGAEADAFWAAAEDRGHTLGAVVEDGTLVGLVALADTLRREAPRLVESLQRTGVKHVVMLTGDNVRAAGTIASEVGIGEYYGALLPEGKVRKVEELVSRYGKVVMVGDGINDAPALARATVGIAMGTRGSDAALAAADVALIGDDLSALEYAIRLGHRSERVIRQNILASLAIVVVLVIGIFAVDLSMFGAVLGHEGSEILIILNGLRVAFR